MLSAAAALWHHQVAARSGLQLGVGQRQPRPQPWLQTVDIDCVHMRGRGLATEGRRTSSPGALMELAGAVEGLVGA